MAKKVDSGHYEVTTDRDTRPRYPPKKYGVIKGKKVNSTGHGGFERHMGVSKSKWYMYTQEEYRRQYEDGSGTGVLDVVSLECEYNSKKKAKKAAERGYCID